MLIADDQTDVLEALRLLLKGAGFEISTASSPAGVLRVVEDEDVDVVLMDLNYTRDTTSGREGLDLLARLRSEDDTLPIVVMTAWGSVEGAVEAMRRGARDYVEKPWDNERLLTTLRTQAELGRALRRSQQMEGENVQVSTSGTPRLIAESRAMEPVLEMMERVGPSSANVLITGEHGTGKEVAARWLHAVSDRARKPLVAVNVGGFSEGVFESEIFGHVKGAFTDAKSDRVGCFEMADGGTLFLDEIANITLAQQAKLLRVLERGEVQRVGASRVRRVDVRVLSATNADLNEAVAAGRFREDLLYRLNTVEVHLPPLRERREDILPLALHFLARESKRYGREIQGFSREASDALLRHRWPGNVRELEHAMERAVLMARGSEISVSDLTLRRRGDDGSESLEELTLDEAERLLIEKALERNGGNVSRAADALGLSRSALYRRLQRYDLSP
ncbi:MAG: sigma-54 dependent transcriptional regulator [Gemmatimonadetes bacterium]|nr:sigma-54 dependent transcriptional regulator [Gemmatimonadota bacterium]NNF37927.1 sigma-54-dependent Fis family transcriptional regulator [Gemmatimonadota bacterium]NNK64264.1 sigma-54-dependent Fis family transcriptional regulator [Gemmatimonadota bacterium]